MRRLLTLTVLIALAACTAAHACPMCKDSVPSSDAPQAGGLPTGFNASVYFLLCSFFVVLGGVLTFIVRSIRQTGTRPAFEMLPRSGPDSTTPREPS